MGWFVCLVLFFVCFSFWKRGWGLFLLVFKQNMQCVFCLLSFFVVFVYIMFFVCDCFLFDFVVFLCFFFVSFCLKNIFPLKVFWGVLRLFAAFVWCGYGLYYSV